MLREVLQRLHLGLCSVEFLQRWVELCRDVVYELRLQGDVVLLGGDNLLLVACQENVAQQR